MKTIAIYHKDCIDGTAAAAVVMRKFPDALLFPLSHGFESHELEPIIAQASQGDRILTVDCVIGVKEFLAQGFEVTSVDHHAGIQSEMEELAKTDLNFKFIFDNSKSGASLSWTYFFPDEKMPELLKFVQDADIWTWKYGRETKNVNNFLFLLINKPEETLKLFNTPLDAVMRDGETITKYTEFTIELAVEKTEPIYLMIGETRVPFYNITTLKSESGNRLATLRKETVALFSIDGDKVKVSFRSLEGQNPSALDLAQKVNGGGHKHAAGAGMTLEYFLKALAK